MTPDEQAALDHDRQTLARRELKVERRDPLPGQGSLPFGEAAERQERAKSKRPKQGG